MSDRNARNVPAGDILAGIPITNTSPSTDQMLIYNIVSDGNWDFINSSKNSIS